jgi:hypothetical protein
VSAVDEAKRWRLIADLRYRVRTVAECGNERDALALVCELNDALEGGYRLALVDHRARVGANR